MNATTPLHELDLERIVGETIDPPEAFKAAVYTGAEMMELLGVGNLYDLNRLHVQVESTIDVPLQKRIVDFLQTLSNPEVVKAYGLNVERLLENADPRKVIYSFLLVEPTPQGNLERVQADNLAAPFDFNKSVKLELGSTAKLRTLAHYLDFAGGVSRKLDLPFDFAKLDRIAVSACGTAYLAGNRYQRADRSPYVYRTDDYGASWRAISASLPAAAPANVIVEDPVNASLLFLGTDRGKPERSYSQTDLWVVDAPGGTPRNLTATYDFDAGGGLSGDQRAPRGAHPAAPVWSPDGRTLIMRAGTQLAPVSVHCADDWHTGWQTLVITSHQSPLLQSVSEKQRVHGS